MSLRQRLTLAVLILLAGMVAAGLLAVLTLRAQGQAIERAEDVFTSELGPVIDLAQVIPNARRTLPDRPTATAAPADDVAAWRAVSREVTSQLGRVRESARGGTTEEAVDRAVDAWIEARAVGDRLLLRPSTADDILAFDRPFRQLRAEVAGMLGALQPVVAEPIQAAPRELDRLAGWLVAGVAIIAVFSVGAAGALLRSVLSSVSEVRRAALAMADGDLDARAPEGAGEFGDLAAVLNLMAQRLDVERSALTVKATRDGLTGVLNSREIKERLTTELERSRRYDAPVGVVLLDLDHFKRVNDTYGHLSGDRALVAFARAIESAVRPVDLVGRYGGEEFLVVVPEADAAAVKVVAERIRVAVESIPVILPTGDEISLTTSAGVCSSGGAEPPDAVIARADAALYRAKQQGRNRVIVAALS